MTTDPPRMKPAGPGRLRRLAASDRVTGDPRRMQLPRVLACIARAAILVPTLACAPAPPTPPQPAPRLAASADPTPAPVPRILPDATGPEGHVEETTSIPAPAPAPDVAPLLAAETRSVHPGINAAYRDPRATRRWARRFERDGREVHDHRAQIVQALGLRPGLAVADIGAGTGLFTLAFADAVGPTGTVFAVDVIPHFLTHIRARLEKAGVTHVRLIQASERSAELPPASVDVVFMSDAYHHLEYPQHVLASLRRALRPGGSLWVIDFHRGPDSDAWLRRHVRADRPEVLQELAQAGFELVSEPPLLRENYVLQLRPRPGP